MNILNLCKCIMNDIGRSLWCFKVSLQSHSSGSRDEVSACRQDSIHHYFLHRPAVAVLDPLLPPHIYSNVMMIYCIFRANCCSPPPKWHVYLNRQYSTALARELLPSLGHRHSKVCLAAIQASLES